MSELEVTNFGEEPIVFEPVKSTCKLCRQECFDVDRNKHYCPSCKRRTGQ